MPKIGLTIADSMYSDLETAVSAKVSPLSSQYLRLEVVMELLLGRCYACFPIAPSSTCFGRCTPSPSPRTPSRCSGWYRDRRRGRGWRCDGADQTDRAWQWWRRAPAQE